MPFGISSWVIWSSFLEYALWPLHKMPLTAYLFSSSSNFVYIFFFKNWIKDDSNSIVLYNFQKFHTMISYNPITILFFPPTPCSPSPSSPPFLFGNVASYSCFLCVLSSFIMSNILIIDFWCFLLLPPLCFSKFFFPVCFSCCRLSSHFWWPLTLISYLIAGLHCSVWLEGRRAFWLGDNQMAVCMYFFHSESFSEKESSSLPPGKQSSGRM